MPNPALPRDPESRQFRPVFIQFEELWFAPGLQACRVQPCADSPVGRIAANWSSSVVGRRSLPAHTLWCALGSPRNLLRWLLRRLCLAWSSGVGPMARISGLFLEAVFLWCSSGYRPDPASPVQTLGFVAGGIFMPQDHGGKADLSNQSSGSGPTPLLAEVCLPEICSILPAASSGNIFAGS